MSDDHHILVGIRFFLTAIKYSKPSSTKANISVFPFGLQFLWIILSIFSTTAKIYYNFVGFVEL